MRIFEINMLHNGSTGKIMFQIAQCARDRKHTVLTASPVIFSRHKINKISNVEDHFIFGSTLENAIHYYIGTFFGINGFLSYFGTKKLLNKIDEFKPDIIHLHNLHNYTMNMPLLFKYIKKNNIRVVWTFHDCWPFTGHCPYFEIVNCSKWETECCECPQPRIYPKMYLDTSKYLFRKKKSWFTGIENLTIVTPSEWLAGLVKRSFLREYNVQVINNGINTEIFHKLESNVLSKYGIDESKFVVLGVAFDWGYRKGLDVFKSLSFRLGNNYQIVLVGTNEQIEAELESTNIVSIRRTDSQKELAEIYSSATVFVNPTREDNYPTVNMESIACGTPVITFRTGGSPEIVKNNYGIVVDCDDVDAMECKIKEVCSNDVNRQFALDTAVSEFDDKSKFQEYVDLYENSTYYA